MRKHEPLDLTPEEREECIREYIDQWRHSSGSALAEAKTVASLKRIGMDRDEINYLIRTNPPM